MTRSFLLQEEPRYPEYNPPGASVSDQDAQTPQIVGLTGIHIQGEQDADQYSQDDDLAGRLQDESDVGDLVASHHVGEIVLLAVDLSIFEFVGFFSHLRGVASKTGEGSKPEREAHLICDETDHIQASSSLPLVLVMDTKPAESKSPCDYRPKDQNVWAPSLVSVSYWNLIKHSSAGKQKKGLDVHLHHNRPGNPTLGRGRLGSQS